MAEAVATEVRKWRAVHRYARVSSRKARLVIDLIRGQHVNAAQDTLRFTNKRVSAQVSKVLASAIAALLPNIPRLSARSVETPFAAKASASIR